MADSRPQAPAAPSPQALQAPQQPVPEAQHVPQLNWSHSKSEFLGKPEEGAVAQLLRMNNWMDTHQFQEGKKSKDFEIGVFSQ